MLGISQERFTLALLFRAFEAEAFVIPTGSMAPALMGRHKDLVCEECGRDYRVGCSAEEDDQSDRADDEPRATGPASLACPTDPAYQAHPAYPA